MQLLLSFVNFFIAKLKKNSNPCLSTAPDLLRFAYTLSKLASGVPFAFTG